MNLENMTKIYARGDSRIQLKVIPGHFVTSQSHITHYLDLTTMKLAHIFLKNLPKPAFFP